MNTTFPRQCIPYRNKTKEWAKQCIRYADNNSLLSSSTVRKTVAHKKLNYDLLNGKLHMDDLQAILNPEGFKFSRKDNKPIVHYPVVNRMLEVLMGEYMATDNNYKAVITNPTAISEKEKAKKEAILQSLQELVTDSSLSEEDYRQKIQDLSKYYNYDYQDMREYASTQYLKHFSKEQDFKDLFSDGFWDMLSVNEAIFQVTVESGEPVLHKLNPNKVLVYGNGYSNKVEDADMIVIEDYWQIGRILDVYYDKLTKQDIKFLEDAYDGRVDGGDVYGAHGDPLNYFKWGEWAEQISDEDSTMFKDGVTFNQLPYDMNGNIRVLQVYWKSIRKIKKVKSYNEETGETEINFYNEDYIPDTSKGEEVEIKYVNEAWHGTMIGASERAIFVDLGPCEVQYNRLSNPSKCHFGIIGQIFNHNEATPYSIVDKTKPYAYLYDVTLDKLAHLMKNNMGKIIQLNGAMMPDNWDFEKWVYYAKQAGVVLIDPFKEGNQGASKNKLAGMFQTPPVIDAELGNSIQAQVNLLSYIEQALQNIIGITPQRLGAIQNRETVGGVERATMQSAHVTRWYFEKYRSLMRRVYECFLDTACICAKHKGVKFQYISDDMAQKTVELDGDSFASADYGVVMDGEYDTLRYQQQVEQAAQMALQSQTINLSAYLKLLATSSRSEQVKIIENSEQMIRQQQQQQQQAMMQQQQQIEQMKMQQEQAKMQLQDQMNQRDNETRVLVANIEAMATVTHKEIADPDTLTEQIREFDAKLALDKEKLEAEKNKSVENNKTKIEIAKLKSNGNNN